ncbi:MAG: tRNA (adenosine(37)-N6)-threonylcarbamoyltransferase complex dimerization subunit type 1 TsaB [Bacilli bacterium]|nr:tRNA (adenosine(37)-N6)-threonylcarbamoyltransferase complex dimerization subunit type 1 TsaB [Bacilli bacterium]
MIKVLIDSSNTMLAVGLSKDGEIIAEVAYEAWQRQSELLVSELDRLLNENSVQKVDISCVVCSKGPGSYTGVRIALSVAKVLACAIKVPLYLVSSLEALKDSTNPSICLMNARSKRSYIGVYEGDKTLKEDAILENTEVLTYIKEHPTYRVCGDVGYLGLDSKPFDVLKVLNESDVERNLCPDPRAAKPVYLKDVYPI